MCCVLAALLLIGPRLAAVVWYFVDTARWSAAFNNILWPILGVILLPWTTMAYVFMSPGGVDGLQWLVVVIGLIADLSSSGGGWMSRNRRG
jgi:hypothetical protein